MSTTTDQPCPKCNTTMRFIQEASAYECPACGAQKFVESKRSAFASFFRVVGKAILVLVAIVSILLGIAFVGCLFGAFR